MTNSLIDSASAMAHILNATPEARPDLVREMWAPMAGMYHFIPGGLDMADVHRQNFGFDADADAYRLRDGLDALITADAWRRIEAALENGIAALKATDLA